MKLWGFINGEQVEIDSDGLPQEVQDALFRATMPPGIGPGPRVEESDQFDPFDTEIDPDEVTR